MIVTHSVAELIGQTPMILLRHLTGPDDASIYAKLESFNASGSVKDRTVKYLIEYAESSGELTRDKTIIEATSGNTGVATAMLAAAKGYPSHIIMPDSASLERRKIIAAYGATLELTPGELGTGGAIERKKQVLTENPGDYLDLEQFKSPVNVLAHYQTLGGEILDQMEGRLDALVVGLGTAGTGVGVSKRLKQHDPSIRVVGVTPCICVDLPGLRNPCSMNGSSLFDESWFDEIIYVEETDLVEIIGTAKETAMKAGLLVGFSGAANLFYAARKAQSFGSDERVVTILADSGDRYLSTGLFANP